MEIQFIRAPKFLMTICLPENDRSFNEDTRFSVRSCFVNVNDVQKLSSHQAGAKPAGAEGSGVSQLQQVPAIREGGTFLPFFQRSLDFLFTYLEVMAKKV